MLYYKACFIDNILHLEFCSAFSKAVMNRYQKWSSLLDPHSQHCHFSKAAHYGLQGCKNTSSISWLDVVKGD